MQQHSKCHHYMYNQSLATQTLKHKEAYVFDALKGVIFIITV